MNIKDSVIQHLKNHGIRPSMQRAMVMQFLMENPIHPTVDEIFLNLVQINPTMSKTTVYNTLKLLLQHNAIISLTIDEKNVRYDADTSDHAHFRCNICGRLYDFQQPHIVHHDLAPGFTVDFCHVYYKGTCPNCTDKINN